MSTIPKEYLDSSFDFGFTATDDITQVIEHPQQPAVSTEDITGLLVNLMKNPEKDYINWPNRQPMIQKQIDKIIAITRA